MLLAAAKWYHVSMPGRGFRRQVSGVRKDFKEIEEFRN